MTPRVIKIERANEMRDESRATDSPHESRPPIEIVASTRQREHDESDCVSQD